MPWVRFTKAFEFRHSPQAFTAYKDGDEYLVQKRCADEAIAAGAAEPITRNKKKTEGDEDGGGG